MNKWLIVFVTIIFIGRNNNAIAQNENSSSKIDYKIIPSINSTWGYDIFIDGKLKIHQSSMPCFNGVEGFKTKASATKVAELVMGKIRKGEMPPMITIEEMKKLKVI